MSEEQYEERQKVSGGRKFLAAFGILLVSIGIFLAAFGISFKMLMLPEQSAGKENEQSEIERLKIENSQLEEDVRRLEEENEILKGGKSGNSASDSKSSSKNSSSSSSKSSSSKSSSSSDED